MLLDPRKPRRINQPADIQTPASQTLAQTRHFPAHHIDKSIVDFGLDVNALHPYAKLAAIDKRPPYGRLGGALERGVLKYDHGMLAAQLKDDGFKLLCRGAGHELSGV